MIANASSPVAGSSVAGPSDTLSSGVSSYPGGKSGAGIYQRLINQIPPHRVLVSAFAGHCGVTRHIRPAEHTIVIDADAAVCQWWDDWCRSPAGRALEIHHCDAVGWLAHRFGITEYSAAPKCGIGSVGNHDLSVSLDSSAEYFVFCDSPYVLSERSGGRIYRYEMSDAQHRAFSGTVSRIPAAKAALMVCGYRSPIYSACDRVMRSIDHRVPTRGGLQDERLWMNYPAPERLHDYRYLGGSNRERERIRRRQRNWVSQLQAMDPLEREAMLEALISNVKAV